MAYSDHKKQQINLYQGIVQQTDLAVKAMDAILDKTFDGELTMETVRTQREYETIRCEAVKRLIQAGIEPRRTTLWAEAVIRIRIDIRAFIDSSTSYLSELLIRLNNYGIIRMGKLINRYDKDTKEDSAYRLATRLLQKEREQSRKLERFL